MSDPWSGEVRATVGTNVAAEHRARALNANERSEALPDTAREHIARTLQFDDDPEARLARAIVELSQPAYRAAFFKWARDPVSGGHEWTDQEREAVGRVRYIERAMSLTGSAGGFLLPYELDPNIIISSTGYVDPMRAVSRVETTAYNTKKFVTSAGVTSHWYAEAAQVSDDSPTLVQPSIDCNKAMAFVPVSFELYEDSSIAAQIGAVFADSKAAEEARVFTTGAGTTEPKGVITAVAAVGGSVVTSALGAVAIADIYANQAALPPRWRPRAQWMANLTVVNAARQLVAGASLTTSIVDDSTRPPRMLGWTLNENSNMDGTIAGGTTNDYVLLSGDFQQYAIVDRIGSTLEVVPQLFGANQRPTGQRGFLMHWRVGADVLIADAFRLTNYSA